MKIKHRHDFQHVSGISLDVAPPILADFYECSCGAAYRTSRWDDHDGEREDTNTYVSRNGVERLVGAA
jgi:hypothetical protein